MLLLDYESRLVPIKAEWISATNNIASQNRVNVIIAVVVLLSSFVVSAVISIVISWPMERLMNEINGFVGPVRSTNNLLVYPEEKSCQ